MSQLYPSPIERDHQFFLTLKRYAERLNEEKNISLQYLQTINKLSVQLSQKNQIIQKLTRQNQQLKDKLSLYEQVMTRSRILINTGGNKNLQNHSTMAVNINGRSFSPRNNYASSKLSILIGQQKFTESFIQSRNELQYLKEYDFQEYQKLQSKIKNQKNSVIIHQTDPFNPYSNKIKDDKIIQIPQINYKHFPIFEDFIIIKPTQNTNSSPQNLHQLKVLFSLTTEQIKKGNKVFESISTYLCHNSGSSWIPQEYKTQIILNPCSTASQSGTANSLTNIYVQSNTDPLFIYLSNSPQTLQPIVQSPNTQQLISPIYQEFNPSLYFFGICYKSHCLEYINGKLHKIPLIYCFVTRYPFLAYWRELLELIVERLNVKNQKDLSLFNEEMKIMKQKSINKLQGMFIQNESNIQFPLFQFQLLQKHITWRKINSRAIQKVKIDQPRQRKRAVTTTNIKFENSNALFSVMTPNSILPISSLIENIIPSIILSQLSTTFNSYNIELIIDVLLLLMLQIPIAIISKHQSLLQKFMLYFVYIIKPLKYPFPIIFNLPLNMSVVLQSPFPSFLGINDPKIIQPYMFERTVFDLDQKVAKSWPNIDFYNQSRQCIVKWIIKLTQNQDKQISKLQKINQIVKILITSSKYYPQELKQLRTYRKYFKKTQIWHLYSHSQDQKNGQLGHS